MYTCIYLVDIEMCIVHVFPLTINHSSQCLMTIDYLSMNLCLYTVVHDVFSPYLLG